MIKPQFMRYLLLTWMIGCSSLLFAQGNSQDSAWIRDNYYKVERYITMRDGVRLFTSMYIPKDSSEPHPILLKRTPYSCAPYGEDKWAAAWLGYQRYYFREGYIMVTQDVRGRWMSEGEFVDIRPFNKEKQDNTQVDEASDTYDAIDWLVKNLPHNNARVGVLGTSYPGFYASMAAACGHPALKAVSPQAPVTDWFMGDDFHHNGVLFEMDAWDFYSDFGKPRPAPTTIGPAEFNFYTQDNYKFYLQTGSLKHLYSYSGDSLAFLRDMYAHPNLDEFWKARNARVAMYHIKPAMLVVGGLFDAEDCFGAWNLFKAIRQQSPQTNARLVMGPWYHGQWGSNDGTHLGNAHFGSNTSFWYQNHLEIPFFNYFLKGKGADPSQATATVFFSGENNWKNFGQWPPAQKQDIPVYLLAGGALGFEKPAVGHSYSEYISDPAHPVPYSEGVHTQRTREYMTDDQRFASWRTDVLSFQTDTLDADLTLAGPVVADLKVAISTTDADFVVKIIDVFPDNFQYPESAATGAGGQPGGPLMGGYEMLVRGEIMRGRFRRSFEKPEPFKPGKTETVGFTLPDVAHTFRKGHRLMIQIQSSWFPLASMNPQTWVDVYQADNSDFQKSTIRIFHDHDNASSILLPVLK